MKTINTLSVFITFCLALLITLFLASAKVQAAKLPQTALIKAETVSKTALNKVAMETLASTMLELPVTTVKPVVTLNTNLVKPMAIAAKANKAKATQAELIAD